MVNRRKKHEDFMKERRSADEADRRESDRHKIAITMELTAGNDLYFHVSGNLSTGGAFFSRAIPHPIGTTVQLTFQLPGEDPAPIRCSGEVVNIPIEGKGLGMGVRFIDLSAADNERIEAFAAEVVADDHTAPPAG